MIDEEFVHLVWIHFWAEVAVFIIFGAIGFAGLLVVVAYERLGLFGFFSITHNRTRLVIYMSHLHIKPEGTLPIGGQTIRRGYSGEAINRKEYDGARKLQDLFNSGAVGRLPGVLRRLFATVLPGIRRGFILVTPEIQVSPRSLADLPSTVYRSKRPLTPAKTEFLTDLPPGSLVAVGSGIYNAISQRLLSSDESWYAFGKNDRGERAVFFRHGQLAGVEVPGRSLSNCRELAVIQRYRNIEDGAAILVAGVGASATYCALVWLAENWRRLYRRYGSDPFRLCLAFESTAEDIIESCSPIDEDLSEPTRLGPWPRLARWVRRETIAPSARQLP